MPRPPLTGLFCVAKPAGITSRAVVDELSRLTRSRRVGHAGTLDPLATGVLLVCLGPATRLVSLAQSLPKRYLAQFELGKVSDTDDCTGQVTVVENSRLPSRDDLERLLPRYTGVISQVPPQYSAIKLGGQRAYDLARQGQQAPLEPRPVEVHALRLRSFESPGFELEIECGSGTYVRSIGRDLGRDLGCGAVMTSLERTAIGPFTLERAVALESLDRHSWREALIPPVEIVSHFPRLTCSDTDLDLLAEGRPVPLDANSRPEWSRESAESPPGVALVSRSGDLLAVGELSAGHSAVQPRLVFPESLEAARVSH
ncbi:MAG: tRNA pseudouridine(55) synthase TruB [Planctomycetaceae bacterium]|jgi:tRNA pseudouridine55 synthase